MAPPGGMPVLRPTAGFSLQTESTGTPAARWFVNMTKHKMCEMPLAPSGATVSRDWILQQGIASLQVPFDLGSFRKLKERAEGAKKTTYCIDVVFCPLIIQLFMDDEFCNLMETYRPYVMNLALKRIEESIGVKLSSQKLTLVKSFRYKDGEEGDDSRPREFAELPDEQDSFDAPMPERPKPKEEEPAPLIEDCTPGIKKKPAIKKGFFNNSKSSLYGNEGSKEGVLPENAGDPMGWMPKKLRNTCKIVDCNDPQYKAQEEERKKVQRSNEMNQEFRDSLLGDMDKWTKKKQREEQWEADAPDGTDAPVARKYDNDYSRFDNIDDDDEEKEDDRDWYIDDKGNRRDRKTKAVLMPAQDDVGLQTRATSSTAGVHKESTAVKKGFFDGQKKSIYGKEGSAQGGPIDFSKIDESALMKELQNMPSEERELMEEFKKMLDSSSPPTASPSFGKTEVAAKTPDRRSPEFTINEIDDGLQLIIKVPELESMKGVDLDVTEKAASVIFPSSVGLKPLKVELPAAVVPSSVKAKFSKKTHQITVSLPTASAAQGGA
eukprot:TRINITY_DN81365_c0_g1_i1.p1 TRINITY_DN81365_c0_g1~~TRINITY_DN81365_c0_g1_i1.p1  ORF type:complete len:549 (+),score=133.68 TRINITY_DN81365_c0_g1_i1:149-1795(+)